MSDRAAVVSVRRVDRDGARVDHDLVVTEAPLSIVVTQADRPEELPLGIIMRTPGHDRELVIGLLYAEGIIQSAADVAALLETADRVWITLARHRDLAPIAAARAQVATSACGLCGRLAMTQLDRHAALAPGSPLVDPRVIASLPSLLQPHQTIFAETGGLHAAGLFDADGTLLALHEDVGRHNAVDKTIGSALIAERMPGHSYVLAVSGRVAYEIVQKAAMAAIPIVVAVGAPSTLAVDAARAAGITLIGFVRDNRFNIYTHADRVRD